MRVLLTTQPAFSHAAQLVPLARELQRQDHEVTFAVAASYAPRLTRLGFEVCPLGPDWQLEPGDPVYERTVGVRDFFGFPLVSDVEAVNGLVETLRTVQADLVIREYSEFSGWAAARKAGVPLVTHGIIHRLPPAAEAGVLRIAGELCDAIGIHAPQTIEDLLGALYLDIVPPSFRCPWEPASLARPTRPSLFDGDHRQPPAWLGGLGRQRPLIYVTLGTIFTAFPDAWRAMVTALAQLDADALVTTGNTDVQALGELPGNVRAERFVPQSQVLPHCQAVVCHAGFNTIIGAFAHGLPVLCVPLTADQPLNAGCCTVAGAGLSAANSPAVDARGPLADPRLLDPDELASAIRRLLDEPDFRAASSRIAAEIAAMPGPSETVADLESLVSTPVSR